MVVALLQAQGQGGRQLGARLLGLGNVGRGLPGALDHCWIVEPLRLQVFLPSLVAGPQRPGYAFR